MTPNKLTPEDQAAVFNLVLRRFAEQLYAALKENLGAKSPHVPNVTLQNLSDRVIAANANNIAGAYELWFQDSGRHVDMRRLREGKPTNLEAMREWVKEQGLSKFAHVPGYGDAPTKLSEAKQIERIADAISFSRARGIQKTRKQQSLSSWLNRTFYAFFGKLIENFQTRQADFLKEAHQSELIQTYSNILI